MTFEELLAQLAADPSKLAELLEQAGVTRSAGSLGTGVAELRANGVAIKAEWRNEMLAKLAAGEHVEIELDLLAYEQRAGERNRNSVRFRDGAMTELGRTGTGSPFLRDHEQWDSRAKAGRVLKSATTKLGDGNYEIRQTVKLSAPWAVEMALRGLMDTVSIGWRPTGPVMCSLCDAPIFEKCWHFPGERFREQDLGEKGKRIARDASGDIVVEWIYTKAELVETSVVNIPGVPNARIDGVRASMFASLAAQHPSLRSVLEREGKPTGEDIPEEKHDMDPKLLALLGLAATATADEVLAAVASMRNEANADRAELQITRSRLTAFQGDIDALNADKRKRDEDAFIASALSTGRMGKGEEPMIRALYESSPERARKLMEERPAGSVTPVGQQRQSANDPDPVITGGESLAPAGRGRDFALAFGWRETGADGKLVARSNRSHRLGATNIANAGELDAAKIGFHAAFLQILEQNGPDPLEQIYTQINSSRPVEEWDWLGDLPGFEEWTTDRRLAGLEAFKLRVTAKDWSNGLRMKANDFKDDALGLLPPRIQGLAQKARRHRSDLMVKLLLNGFDGNAYPDVGNGLAYDGAFFFSDSGHRGGNDNKHTAVLGANGVTAAELLLRSMTTYDGQDPLDTHGTHIICGPKLEHAAVKLVTQEYLASGESNPHKGKYQVMVSNRIRGDFDDYWFLSDLSQPIKPCLLQMREEISTSAIIGQQGSQQDSVPRFMSNVLLFGAEARYNVAYFEHRLIVGSTGAG
ncbi:MAG: Mu-like prophage major head subunit gpT family protein [Kofleriaceae bacterium]